jgi:endonuclease YncB( thermonuclease family)
MMRAIAVLLCCLTASAAPAAERLVGQVVELNDGDTITIVTPQKVSKRIRIASIDAPEKSQAFGMASKLRLSELIAGKIVVAQCSKADRNGRMICRVDHEGRDVGLQLIHEGMAWHFKKYAKDQDWREAAAYASAERSARGAGRGLWRDRQVVAPWDWRADKRHR